MEYFVQKRYENNNGEQLRPVLKKEENVVDADKDPYVCFRQREMKTERKIRRSDMLSMDKVKSLHDDLIKAKQILDLVYEREVAQKDLVEVQHIIFEKRLRLRKLRKHFGITSTDALDRTPEQKQKKRRGVTDTSTKIKIPTQSLRDAAHLVSDMDSHLFDENKMLSAEQRIEEKIKREKQLNEKGGWIDCTEFPFLPTPKQELWGRHLGIEIHSQKPFVHTNTRRRIGRGGRVLFDRQTRVPEIDTIFDERDIIQDPIKLIPELESILLIVVLVIGRLKSAPRMKNM